MTLKECDELETRLSKALIDFVERATKEHATPEEVEALPGVACVLKDMLAR